MGQKVDTIIAEKTHTKSVGYYSFTLDYNLEIESFSDNVLVIFEENSSSFTFKDFLHYFECNVSEKLQVIERFTASSDALLKTSFFCPNNTCHTIKLQRFVDVKLKKRQLLFELKIQSQNDWFLSQNNFYAIKSELFFVTTLDGVAKFASQSWCDLLGYSISEIVNQNFVELIHTEDRPIASEAVRVMLETGGDISNLETRYFKQDGTIVWFAWNGVYDKSTGLIYTIANDITPQKREEEKVAFYNKTIVEIAKNDVFQNESLVDTAAHLLRKGSVALACSRISFWLINANTMDCVCSVDVENLTPSNIDYFNLDAIGNYIKILECDGQLISENCSEDTLIQALFGNYMHENNIVSMIDTGIVLQGKLRAILCIEQKKVLRTWSNADISFARYVADLLGVAIETESKLQAEKALANNSAALEMIFNTTDNLMALLRVEGEKITYELVNSAYALSYDSNGETYTAEMFVGKDFLSFVGSISDNNAYDIKAIYNQLIDCITKNEPLHFQEQFCVDNKMGYYDSVLQPILSDFNTVHVLYSAKNITELVFIQLQQKEDAAFLEQVLQTFPAVISVVDLKSGTTKVLNEQTKNVVGVDLKKNESFSIFDLPSHATSSQHDDIVANFRTVMFDSSVPLFERNHVWEQKIATTSGEIVILENTAVVLKASLANIPEQFLITTVNITERNTLQAELTFQKQYLKSIIESPEGLQVFALDQNFCYEEFNRNHSSIMLTINKVYIEIGRPILDYIKDTTTRVKLRKKFERVMNGEEFRVVEEVLFEDASIHFFEYYYSPLYNRLGNIFGIAAFVRDITKLKIAEAEVVRSQELLNSINTNLNEALVRVRGEGEIEYVNKACCAMFGYESAEEMVVHSANEMFADFDALKNIKKEIGKKQKINNFEIALKRRDGSTFISEINATLTADTNGHPIVNAAIRDVTTQKQIARELIEKENLLSTINHNISEAIYRSSASKGLVYANTSFARMFGYANVSELMQYSIENLYFNPEARQYVLQELQMGRPIKNREVVFKRKDGSTFIGSLNVSISLDINGNELVDEYGDLFLDGSIVDITHIKKTEEALLLAKEQAEEMNKLKTSFLSNMSHEIRTPLNGIIGIAQLMKDEYQHLEEISEYTDLLEQSGLRLLNTINSILEISKLESNQAQLQLQRIELTSFLKDFIKPYVFLAKKNGLECLYEFESENMFIDIDPFVLELIVNNLLGNAVKFTEKGHVLLSVSNTRIKNTNKICIMVKDTGVGIGQEFLPKIFDAFQQESGGMNRKFQGSGLGLSIVKKYTELFGGTITVESQKGVGSTFKVYLPSK